MRIAVLLVPLTLTACGIMEAEPEVEFTTTTGRIVTVKDQCELVFTDGKSSAVGACNEILPRSRTQENRSASVQRKLEITYAYTSPADGLIYQAKNDLQQPLSSRVPRPGDSLPVMAHPQQAMVTRLQ